MLSRLYPCDPRGSLGTPQYPVQVQHRGLFRGPYAATPVPLLNISVVAEEDCEILLLNVKRLLTSCPPPATITRSSSAIWSAFWQTNTAFQREDHPYQQADHPGKSCCPTCLPNPSGSRPSPLTFPLTVSSWQIFSAWSVPPCRWSFPSCKRKGCWSQSGIILSC